MDDDEFRRIKEAEKERLRSQKRLRKALRTLKRRQKVQSAVRSMVEGARGVLRRTDDLVSTLRTQVARQQARLEVALEDEDSGDAGRRAGASLDAGVSEQAVEEQTMRDQAMESRAEELVRQLRLEMGASGDEAATTPSDRSIGRRPAGRTRGNDDEGRDGGRGGSGSAGGGSDEGTADGREAESTRAEDPDDSLPEKTIGRMPRGDDEAGE
jgi:hypothetical protein